MSTAISAPNLSRALRALNMTNAKLVAELSAAHADGKRTSAATVSNWTTGKVPVPASVALLLRDRLLAELKKSPPKLDGLKIISVGGGKGGSGSSPMAVFLAAAARLRGYRVRVAATVQAELGALHWSQDFAGAFNPLLTVNLMDLKGSRRALAAQTDFLIIDVGSKSMLNDQMVSQIDLTEVDLAVVPVDPTYWIDRDPALMVAASLSAAGFGRFLLQPLMSRNSISKILRDGFDPALFKDYREHVSPHVVFRRSDVRRPGMPFAIDELFQDDDLQCEYAAVFDELLLHLGVSEDRLELSNRDPAKLSTQELLEVLVGSFDEGEAAQTESEVSALRLESAWRNGTKPGRRMRS